MTDKIDSTEERFGQNINNSKEYISPYRFDGKFTTEELAKISNFMHAEFSHIRYGGPRDKGIIIENPPTDICTAEKWKEVMDTVLLPEWENFNPLIKRQNKIIVRFVSKINGIGLNQEPGGFMMDVDNESFATIRYTNDEGKKLSVEHLTFNIMHELAENDFWSKTQPNEIDAIKGIENSVDSIQNYINIPDEKVANRRAIKAIRRMWPNVEWVVPEENRYEEDR